MKFSLFYHSLISDWNHGNAHFLRGVVKELLKRGHQVTVFEPRDGWSLTNLLRDHGPEPLDEFRAAYPGLQSTFYDRDVDLEPIAAGSDVVIIHEWNSQWLVNDWARLRKRTRSSDSFALLFHDTHHRAVSDPQSLECLELADYDGILAFGEVLSEAYRARGYHSSVWTWHEAADIEVFAAQAEEKKGDVVWVGNWGDDERTRELDAFLFRPVQELSLTCLIHGVRYPEPVVRTFAERGVRYGGWLANFKAPRVFAEHRVTVHVPRRHYTEALPGIPTIRPFEAMACGIPLICAPWEDSENLFTPGSDYLVARDTGEMKRHLEDVLNDQAMSTEMTKRARATIEAKHTCGHRVEQLLEICAELGCSRGDVAPPKNDLDEPAHAALRSDLSANKPLLETGHA